MSVTIHVLALAACGSAHRAATDAPLSETDLAVLRVAIESAIYPLIPSGGNRAAVLTMATVMIPLWQAPEPGFPPAPPPPFAGSSAGVSVPPPPPTLDARVLTADERSAWLVRNQISRVIPPLGIAWLDTRLGKHDALDETVIAVSTPSFPTKDTAVLYAQFRCGRLCGEGRIIRFNRGGGLWHVTSSLRQWIS